MASDITIIPMGIMIAVSDYDRSVAFYTRALGFTLGHERTGAPDFEPVMQLHGVKFREAFLTLGSELLTLMCFENPETVPAAENRFNQAGIKKFNLGVSDLELVAQRIIDNGGSILEHTRQDLPEAGMLLAADPDGTWIQLIQRKR